MGYLFNSFYTNGPNENKMSDGWWESAWPRIEWNFIASKEPKLPAVRSIAWLGVWLAM
ncbi:MAG: hypothetical protein ABR611_14205 [Chthoniobacterales bacterium]